MMLAQFIVIFKRKRFAPQLGKGVPVGSLIEVYEHGLITCYKLAVDKKVVSSRWSYYSCKLFECIGIAKT